jgi:PAS domain S-box-containing protein
MNDSEPENRNLHNHQDRLSQEGTDEFSMPENEVVTHSSNTTNERIYQDLIEQMEEGAVTLNQSGTVLYCNAAFAAMIGRPVQKTIDTNFRNYFDEASVRLCDSLLTSTTKRKIKQHSFLRDNRGMLIPVQLSAKSLWHHNHFVLTMIVSDLSLQRKTLEELEISNGQLENKNFELGKAIEQLAVQSNVKENNSKKLTESLNKLRDNEVRFSLIVENVRDYSIILLDADGNIVTWNKGSERIHGYASSEILGKHISTVYSQEDKNTNEPSKNISEAKKNGTFKSEGSRIRKDGSLFFAEVVITALFDDKGLMRGFSKISHDLTARKKNEENIRTKTEELLHLNKVLRLQNEENEKKATELSSANRDLTTLTYISSHDLQEPLRKIQTFIGMILKEKNNLTEPTQSYFLRMTKTAKRMQALLNDLLSYVGFKDQEESFEITDLNTLIAAVINDFEDIIHEKQATIEVLPLGKAVVIPSQFSQLFNNLLGNSLKYFNAEVKLQVKIRSEIVDAARLGDLNLLPSTKYLNIIFSDNGIGFDPRHKDRIFEVFQRLHPSDQYSGTGIGLPICKRIVENHHGIITADGNPGKGARFDIYIPLN